jgi:predicted nuclease with RNAse H fold/uncharacterized protein YprB with RNaseH-like and TPR domain
MLQSTFQHIQGIGKKTEAFLWQKGITDWTQYQRLNGKQLSLFKNNGADPIELSIDAYQKGDLSFFAKNLSKSEFYRVALSFPEDTLFLDIETTGLSLYYDQITLVGWSTGKRYGVYFKDQNPKGLLDALKFAKVIVTFNGSIFDLKFLEKTFPGLITPPVHIDLRFFARRAGLFGGQKNIEPKVGYVRPALIKGMEGEAAPILWYKYRRGDLSALKELVTYNHADIEGMKVILDYAISQIYQINNIPPGIRVQPPFSRNRSNICWSESKPNNGDPYKVYLKKFSVHLKPLITYSELNKIVPLDNETFIGIDLVSSEKKDSGYCILKGNKAETYLIKSDDDMIRLAREAGATLVSIDSPLSLPKGRTSFYDDDPKRDQYGIMRECERILKRRGVNVYPCLIPSMQNLTRRGIELAGKFRKLGIPVIESYPGAAQDIIAIPRKRAGLNYLADALVEFGIKDNFTDKNLTHDELDAITSAIVGLFFWTGKFEAIGNFEEESLIIPDLSANSDHWISRKIYGLSGPIGSGKTTVGKYLELQGFVYRGFDQVCETVLKGKNSKVNHSNLQNIGNDIRETKGQRWLGKKVVENLFDCPNCIIDGLRFPEDHALMVEEFGPLFKNIHFEASQTAVKFFLKDQPTEERPFKAYREGMSKLENDFFKNFSDYTIVNDSDIKNLYLKVNKIIG